MSERLDNESGRARTAMLGGVWGWVEQLGGPEILSEDTKEGGGGYKSKSGPYMLLQNIYIALKWGVWKAFKWVSFMFILLCLGML